MLQKYLAELIGTFTLTLVVIGSVAMGSSFPTAILAGTTLALFVWTIGSISGAHINPAVTIGLLSLKKISVRDAVGYIVAQVIGAALALGLAVMHELSLPIMAASFSWVALCSEIVGTIIFTFGIASVVLGNKDNHHAAFVIGGSLAIGATIAGSTGSLGILNPAVALGLQAAGIAYIIGPIIGSVIGMWLYKKLAS